MKIHNHQLPLAVYREVAAHLQQIEGVVVNFLVPTARSFSYTESQLGGLEISGTDRLNEFDLYHFNRILSYYADRYQPWEIGD
jgi:hypothetical protein